MNEAETRAELIDPALKAAGWGAVEGSRVARELITPGRIQGQGKRARGLACDYVLIYRNQKLGVIEAKKRDLPVGEGVGQAKDYATKLQVRFAFSTNGLGVYQIDMAKAREGDVPAFPSPDELWNLTFAEANLWRDRFAAVPFDPPPLKWSDSKYGF